MFKFVRDHDRFFVLSVVYLRQIPVKESIGPFRLFVDESSPDVDISDSL
jgi:hypothetical protein